MMIEVQVFRADISKQTPMSLHAFTAADVLNDATHYYSTKIQKVDNMLGGGLSRGNILELCGLPGTGKEIIALGLISSVFNAHQEVIFYGMDGSFSHHRVHN
jgi:predicted ATP-dependent serine protease